MMDDIQNTLASYGQEHLLYGVETLDESARRAYLDTLSRLDLPYLTSLFRSANTSPTLGGQIAPSRSTCAGALSPADQNELTTRGQALIRENTVAVVTMAGGQGTRLGYDGPKGCFDVGVGVSLFGLLAERIRRLQRQCGGTLPWYIMTSAENHRKTVDYFAGHSNFSLSHDQIFFFQQGVLPLFNTEGHILLADIGRIAEGPDGNGGVFAALSASGALADMEARGIRYVFFCGIDNALARPADPLFVGFLDRDGAPCASKSVRKASPDERVGVFCTKNNRPCVIEYTELTPEMRSATDEAGELLYGDANIVTHLLRFEALKSVCTAGLPMHTAFKAVPYFSPGVGPIAPREPNAYKFESFIFDAFSLIVWRFYRWSANGSLPRSKMRPATTALRRR